MWKLLLQEDHPYVKHFELTQNFPDYNLICAKMKMRIFTMRIVLFTARKEMLLSLRSLIDAKIEAMEKFEKKRETKKKKIKIE